ncbi:zinc-ribbon domain-containing protein [Roseomonas sp. E05]|uniref:zinc-ribbon domain-containing protein n=1 Tax=Roseomonas sp. E05 TaxID=3046310 RepID=UPI0024BB48A6|nr:zinc-ribbon domain-containing protein [Roseomonas sp. E05]MDJ0386662.1 zinc-ribbon domain-containing protein [Roseomonas sp. E05]
MRIECPGCAAAYEVREELLPPGREVRCARCGQAWVPLAPAAAPLPAEERLASPSAAPPGRRPMPLRVRPRLGAPAAPPEPPPRALPPPEEPPEPPPGLAAPLIAWAVSILVVAGALAALWVWRAEVILLWPPAARLLQGDGG